MKGIVFNLFNQMVEREFGLAVWEQLISQTEPESRGIYTTGSNYADRELLAFLAALSGSTGISTSALLKNFGAFMLGQFTTLYPVFFLQNSNAFEFVKSMESIVHVEIQKLYPDAYVPILMFTENAPNQLIMTYQSKRQLCALVEGLISGTGKYFKTKITYIQTECLRKGDSHCRFELTIIPQ